MALLIGWLGVWSAALADEKYPDGMTIVETPMSGEMQVVTGSKMEMDVAREPASTFKAVIAWAALDRGLIRDVETPLEGAEGLGLRQSLQKSINPPFAILAEKLGGEVLGKYAERSGLIEGSIPKEWMRGGGKEAVHGGDLKTTLRKEHQMAVGWMRAEKPWDREAGKKLQDALVWKGERIVVRAKSGSYGGCLWMTGYGEGKAVTVFLEGAVSRRPEVLKAFFGRWGLESVGR